MKMKNITIKRILRWVANRSSFLSYYRASIECQSKFNKAQKENGNVAPVIVYQPGRVGSQTVTNVLRQYYHSSNVYHFHYFLTENYKPTFERAIKLGYPRQNAAVKLAKCDFYNKNFLKRDFCDPLKVVTLTRDPGAMILSSFSMSLSYYYPEISKMISEQRDKGEIYSHIQQLFIREKEFWFTENTSWFDKELLNVFSINIFEKKFPIEAGYDIYISDRVKILLIRLEDLNRCYRQAFDEFLGIQVESIQKDNSAVQLGYSELYKNVCQAKIFPEEYIQRIYDVPWVKHMYSALEIENFKKKWM